MMEHEFSEKFNEFRRKRDKSLSGLKKCRILLHPDCIEKMGFNQVCSEYYSEGIENHEFHEFEKDNERLVFLETYLNREGGMYFQTLFASQKLKDEFEGK
jgi:hypothetical protein